MKQKLKLGILLVLFLVLLIPQTVQAEIKFRMNDKGEVYNPVSVTAKEKAPDHIWWRTVGFTLKNKKCVNGDPTQKPKSTFPLKEKYKDEKKADGIVYTTFHFPYSFIDERMNEAGVTAETLKKTNNKMYLNGIFQVYAGGGESKLGNKKYTLQDIIHAQSWGSIEGFKDRFNMEVPYNPPKSEQKPVYLTIMRWSSKNGYVVDSTTLLDKRDKRTFYSTTTSEIDAEYHSPISGNKLYLFQTHWSDRNKTKTVHSNGTYRTMKDRVKTKVNPKEDWEGYKISLRALRNRQYEVTGDKGIEIVCVYKNMKENAPHDGTSGTDEITRDIVTPYTSCTIQSNTRYSQIYNSEEAIPSSEYQYVNVMTSEYLTQYTYQQITGVNYYQQKIPLEKKKFKLIEVERPYSYWKIVDLNVYALSSATVENESLPGASVTLTPSSAFYQAPYVSYNVYENNMIEPESGGTTVGQIKVRNDALYFNGMLLMSGEWLEGSTQPPKMLPVASNISENTFYRTGLQIDPTKENEEYDTVASIRYTRVCHYGDDSEGNEVFVDVDNANSVTVHTPTICDAKIQNMNAYNQMIDPEKRIPGLVLDTYFNINLPTEGTHDSTLKGYQTRDYDRFIATREVKFPFDVYQNNDYIKAGTWTTITKTYEPFYLPSWVEEDYYTIEFRSRAINCDANNGLEQNEELANLDYNNYVATDTLDVQVSGRLFGFNVYDITDYPIWKRVFRKPGSLKFTNFNYTVGINNRNGTPSREYSTIDRDPKYTLPIVNGSHPYYQNIGAIKTGYYNRFYVRTMGTFDGKDDYIHIEPKFYFVESNGTNRRKIDLYYTEYWESDNQKHILVKVGSEQDKKNTHRIDRDDPYLGVRGGTAVIREPRTTWTFGDIKLNGSLMLLSGQSHFIPQVQTTDKTLLEKQRKSVQTWFGEYYLPAKIYACPKGFDVGQYALDHNGLDFSEDFWLKKGYIIVNFEIEAVKDGKRYLSYINKENRLNGGYCNMWELEGGILQKTDSDHATFHFKYGDYCMYYADPNKSIINDYESGGIY